MLFGFSCYFDNRPPDIFDIDLELDRLGAFISEYRRGCPHCYLIDVHIFFEKEN